MFRIYYSLDIIDSLILLLNIASLVFFLRFLILIFGHFERLLRTALTCETAQACWNAFQNIQICSMIEKFFCFNHPVVVAFINTVSICGISVFLLDIKLLMQYFLKLKFGHFTLISLDYDLLLLRDLTLNFAIQILDHLYKVLFVLDLSLLTLLHHLKFLRLFVEELEMPLNF